ncbi:hypothetical protein LE181_24555 [Streptomyces sp. SCA3-4]|uniref:hypothetical protein n=1 Tax=Streptomyces sichuanensis TaxID=2871810 RepID=UPI001CE395F6|nr:hypothetical protein [Streptomyces sichuanensis]MCA6095324.1 hypothetical protein [Streptomyces sichuanensis]
MAITQDIRKTATDTAYAAAGAADLAAEKIGQFVTEAPERFEKLRNTDPKALGERVAQQAKQVQTQVTAKATEIVGTIDTDVKKLGQTAQDLVLQGFGQVVTVAAQANDGFEELVKRGRTAVQTWRGEAAEEITEIAVAVEPDPEPAQAPAAKDEQPATGTEAADDDKPAARKPAATRKPAAKKADAKTGDQ